LATFKHIVVATDFSQASRGALELARNLAAETGAELSVLHVCEVPGYSETGPIPYDLVTPMVTRAQARLDDAVEYVRRACPAARGLVKIGVPSDQVLAVAGEVHADLVVIGTHGRCGLAHAVMGSVAERVVRLSPVPVLTVRCVRAD
jgi:nucleotide-binding universal stress UspA family protein